MGQIHTHYDNLKVARTAPPEVIRAAYKTLSQKHHPDHNPDNPDAMRIIQIINAAYQVLSDPVKRQEHDKWIANAEVSATKKSEHTDFLSGFNRHKTSSGAYRKTSEHSPRKPVPGSSGVGHRIQVSVRYFFKNLFRNA